MVKEYLSDLESEISVWLSAQGVVEPVVTIDRTTDGQFGEFSTNVAMRYAKELKKNPLEIAESLAKKLNESNLYFLEKSEAVKPGFVNFYLNAEAMTKHVLGILEQADSFGKNEYHQGETWVVEHTSPNPNKAMHIGHLRNNLVGMGIVRLLQSAGADVKSDAVYNNRGISIAKNMYGYLAHMKKNPDIPTDLKYWVEHKDEWYSPEDKKQRPDLFVTECYVKGEEDFSGSEEVESLVRQMVVDWEAGDEATWALWGHVLQYAYDGIGMSLERLGSHWDKVWYEHEHYQKGKDYVEEGLEKGVFNKLEDGAVLTNLEEDYNLSDTVVLKKDGTSLYITQDLALTDLKKKTYGADKLVWVVGPEQTLAFKQLFAVCEQLGIGRVDDFTHIAYGYVGLRDEDGTFKKMSSRSGTALFSDEVINTVKERIIQRFNEENRHQESDREDLAEKLAVAAVKFALLRSDSNLDISFDINQSVDVQGDSGMYVMYTFVRAYSILKKASNFDIGSVTVPDQTGAEAELLRSLLYFEGIVEKSVDDLSVHHVTQYLLQLCSDFNSWYAKEPVLDGSDREMYKLAIVNSTAITIRNGLALLGIETVEEM